MLISGLSSTITAQQQAYHLGQAWENLPEPKQQFTYVVVSPDGQAQHFHLGPHAPALRGDDVQLVHRLWLNMSRDPGMSQLHHSDIVTYALTRLAADYARSKQEIVSDLRRIEASRAQGESTPTALAESLAYPIRAPRGSFEDKSEE
jgi:hypothetical protein